MATSNTKGSGQGRVRVFRGGRMMRCSGHNGAPCHRAARLIGFAPDTPWTCGQDNPFTHKQLRLGQQKQKKG